MLLLLALAAGGQVALKARRPGSAPAVAEGVLAAVGGLRSVIAEIVWFRADRLQDEGRYVELAQLASTLAFLEPHTPEVWSYAAWNLSYNISVMMPTYEDRWRWVHAAIRLLRDEGLRLNPHDAEIYRELAWMFEIKIGTDLDAGAATYRAKWRAIIEDVARRDAWPEIGMNARRVHELAQRTGMDDLADPQFSAVYWATLGLSHAARTDRMLLSEIIRQAQAIYRKNRTQGKVPST